MELDITSLSESPAFQFSASRMEMGQNAGEITWSNNKKAVAGKRADLLLDTEEKQEAFRDFVESSGGWTREEIDEWDQEELTALCHQWIMGDIREAGADSLDEIDWRQHNRDSKAGQVSSRLFCTGRKGRNRRYFFYIGN